MRARAMSREFWRPRVEGLEPSFPEGTDLEVWSWDEDGRFYMDIFGGKRSKPDSSYYYRSRMSRADALERAIDGAKASAKYKAERAAERKAPHTLLVGSLLSSSWGYDQTNVDFYEVVALNGKTMVTIEKIGGKSADGDDDAYHDHYVSPNPEVRTGKFSKHRVNGNRVRIESFASAGLTSLDARHYETPFGMGH